MAINVPRIPIEEFITGEKFEEACDVDAEKNPHYEIAARNSKEKVLTFFTQTHELVNRIPTLRQINKKFVVVSHNSDGHFQYGPATRIFDYQWKNESNIIHWFCQNCEVGEPNVTPIPIALENTYIFTPDQKQQYMINVRDAKGKKDLKMFICYNAQTNPGERNPPLQMFRGQSWVTVLDGYNNVDLYKRYFDSMVRHQFVLCPDGNGMDTIRIWEALYLGCIPIVKPHIFTQYFAQYLPIIIVKNWSEINIRFLINKLQEMERREYKWDMLKMSYWRNEILKKKAAAG